MGKEGEIRGKRSRDSSLKKEKSIRLWNSAITVLCNSLYPCLHGEGSVLQPVPLPAW